VKINIIDTPGHADFGGEWNGVLRMADGALVLVDAAEGAMPQTRLYSRRRWSASCSRSSSSQDRSPDARAHEVVDEVLDLFLKLGADDKLPTSPTSSPARATATPRTDPTLPSDSIHALMDMILERVPGPDVDVAGAAVDAGDDAGLVGLRRADRHRRVQGGTIRKGQGVALMQRDAKVTPGQDRLGLRLREPGTSRKSTRPTRATSSRWSVSRASRSATRSAARRIPSPAAAARRRADAANDVRHQHVAAGRREGKVPDHAPPPGATLEGTRAATWPCASNRIPGTEQFAVSGRGILHLSILIETMRRESYEMSIGKRG